MCIRRVVGSVVGRTLFRRGTSGTISERTKFLRSAACVLVVFRYNHHISYRNLSMFKGELISFTHLCFPFSNPPLYIRSNTFIILLRERRE